MTGYPSVCSDWFYVPVCNETAYTLLGVYQRIFLCLHVGLFGKCQALCIQIYLCIYLILSCISILSGGFVGSPPGVSVPPPTFRVNNMILKSFNCPFFFLCGTSSSMGTCSSGYATVTCQKGKLPFPLFTWVHAVYAP